jgi:hypothetical protein
MDRFWYHILLRGAVEHAAKIEAEFSETIPGIGLGKSISNASQNLRFLCVPMNSNRRLVAFYVTGYAMLAVVFCSLLLAHPSASKLATSAQPSQPAQVPGQRPAN